MNEGHGHDQEPPSQVRGRRLLATVVLGIVVATVAGVIALRPTGTP